MAPHVVKNCRKLQDLAKHCYGAGGSNVLVADDSFGDGFGLRLWRMKCGVQEIECDVTAAEFEREEGGNQVLGGGTDVME